MLLGSWPILLRLACWACCYCVRSLVRSVRLGYVRPPLSPPYQAEVGRPAAGVTPVYACPPAARSFNCAGQLTFARLAVGIRTGKMRVAGPARGTNYPPPWPAGADAGRGPHPLSGAGTRQADRMSAPVRRQCMRPEVLRDTGGPRLHSPPEPAAAAVSTAEGCWVSLCAVVTISPHCAQV